MKLVESLQFIEITFMKARVHGMYTGGLFKTCSSFVKGNKRIADASARAMSRQTHIHSRKYNKNNNNNILHTLHLSIDTRCIALSWKLSEDVELISNIPLWIIFSNKHDKASYSPSGYALNLKTNYLV